MALLAATHALTHAHTLIFHVFAAKSMKCNSTCDQTHDQDESRAVCLCGRVCVCDAHLSHESMVFLHHTSVFPSFRWMESVCAAVLLCSGLRCCGLAPNPSALGCDPDCGPARNQSASDLNSNPTALVHYSTAQEVERMEMLLASNPAAWMQTSVLSG